MRQKSIQLALNWEGKGEARVDSGRGIEAQTASTTQVSLAHDLMEAVVAAGNMRSALRKVRSNKGSPGVDGMTVEQLGEHLMVAWPKLREDLLKGSETNAYCDLSDITCRQASWKMELWYHETRELLRVVLSHRFSPTSCWTIWIRTWSSAVTGSAGTPTTVTSMFRANAPANASWLR
jgi:hypothetical protein